MIVYRIKDPPEAPQLRLGNLSADETEFVKIYRRLKPIEKDCVEAMAEFKLKQEDKEQR